MDAPRALVFRLLVKGNEALGTRLGVPRVSFVPVSLAIDVFLMEVLKATHDQ